MHRLWTPDAELAPGAEVEILGEEAHHAARVKRLGEGDPVELLDGRGAVAFARVSYTEPRARPRDARLVLTVERVERGEPDRPRLDVYAATPKAQRSSTMVDQLSQIGAASWTPMHTERSVVDPRETKLDRLGRVAAESAKQCGRAYVLETHAPVRFERALAAPDGTRVVLADASGDAYTPTGSPTVRLLIGAEGGWSEAELERARGAGVFVARFGDHQMRIETAAVAAGAVVLDAERAFGAGARPGASGPVQP